MRLRFAVLLIAVLVACEHGGPFPPTEYAPSQPFNAPPLIRLTLNPGEDVQPTWLPDGEIVYSAERRDRVDRDRCLAVMPGTGGAITRYVCRTTAPNDSVDAFNEAAATAAAGGRIAYVRAGSSRVPIIPVSPGVQSIVVAPLADPNAARVVRSLPYLAPSGRTHWGISNLRWLDSTRLIYVGQDVTYPRGCSSCPPDTVRVGLEIAVLDVTAATSAPTVVPGTVNASSVAVGASSDTIYFTREGDPDVYRHIFSLALSTPFYGFGPGRVARDVGWAAGRLFVIVDGQQDIGGDLHILGPTFGTDSVVTSPSPNSFVWYQRPAPSADGRRILAQGYLLAADSSVISSLETWLYVRP